MKREMNRKEKNMLITGIFFFGILIIGLLLVFFLFMKPELTTIESVKAEVIELNKKIQDSKIKGLTLEEFQELARNDSSLDVKQKNIFEEINQNFFTKYFENNSSKKYSDFIAEKEAEYQDNILGDVNEKLSVISRVLPFYSELFEGEEYLTDFGFINYLESLIRSFNLSYTDTIGISEVKDLENYTLSNNDSSLERGISKISLTLNVTGTKRSIINFLHYLENVGKIEFNEETKEISVYSEQDNSIFADFKTKQLEGQKQVIYEDENYNIYNNQIIDIESIEFENYIDSSDTQTSITSKETNEFLDYILNKTSQSRQKYEARISLNFYVRGVEKFKIENFIGEFKTNLTLLEQEINNLINNSVLSSLQKQKLDAILSNIATIKQLTQGSEDISINEVYKNISSYSEVLESYKKEIENIKLINN